MPPVLPARMAMATVLYFMTPVMTPTAPMVAPPAGVVSLLSPTETKKTLIEEAFPDNELRRPGRTRVRTSAYRKVTAATAPGDHTLHNQGPSNSPPPIPNCHASELSAPAPWKEAMGSAYNANWLYLLDQKLFTLQLAWTFSVSQQIKGGNVGWANWFFTWRSDETGKLVKAKVGLVARKFSQGQEADYNEAFAPTSAAP